MLAGSGHRDYPFGRSVKDTVLEGAMTKRLNTGMRAAGYLLIMSGLLAAPFVAVAQEEYAAPTAREKKAAADAALWNKNPAPRAVRSRRSGIPRPAFLCSAVWSSPPPKRYP